MSATADNADVATGTPADVATGAPGATELGNTPSEAATMRIGEVAERTGTTPRTIRYYEELGLLGAADDREQGKHRSYSEADVERISEVVRLKELLNLSLDQLTQLIEADAARAEIRRELKVTEDLERRRALLTQSAGLIASQLELVQARLHELSVLESTLLEKQATVADKLNQMR